MTCEKDCSFKREVNSKRGNFFGISISISCSLFIIQRIISKNFLDAERNNAHTADKVPNKSSAEALTLNVVACLTSGSTISVTVTVAGRLTVANTYNIVNETVTSGGIGINVESTVSVCINVKVEVIAVNLDHAFNAVSGICIVELCILVIASCLSKGGICSDEVVKRTVSNLEKITYGKAAERLGNASAAHKIADVNVGIAAISVHKRKENNLYVGIHLNDGVHSTDVVGHVADGGVNEHIDELIHDGLFTACVSLYALSIKSSIKLIYISKNECLLLGIKITDGILNTEVVQLVGISAVEAHCIHNSAEEEYTVVTVTCAIRDDISILYRVLVLLCSVEGSLGSIFPCGIVRAGPIVVTAVDKFFVSINVAYLECLKEELFNCLCLTRGDLRPSIIRATRSVGIIAIIILVNDFKELNYLGIIIVKLKGESNIFYTLTGHSVLAMIYGNAVSGLKPTCEEIGVCRGSIVIKTVMVVMTVQAIAVRHGVTERYVVKTSRHLRLVNDL